MPKKDPLQKLEDNCMSSLDMTCSDAVYGYLDGVINKTQARKELRARLKEIKQIERGIQKLFKILDDKTLPSRVNTETQPL